MPIRVLVVEDDAEVRTSLGELLRTKGYNVREVSDGLTARELLTEELFDAVTLDLKLPGIDGDELIASLSEPPPVIVYSAFAVFDPGNVRGKLGARITRLLRKPAAPQDLLDAVAEAIAS